MTSSARMGLFLCHVPGGPGLSNVTPFPLLMCITRTHSSPSPVSPQCSVILPLWACAVHPRDLSSPYAVFSHPTPLSLPLVFCLLPLHTVPMCSQPCGGQFPPTLPLTVSPLAVYPLPYLNVFGFFPETVGLHGDVTFSMLTTSLEAVKFFFSISCETAVQS